MKIAQDTAVTIEYTLRNDDGDILDQSAGSGPLVYLHGHGNIVPGLESALTGKSAGDSFKVRIDPEQAYGLADGSLIQEVGRDRFRGMDQIEVGMQFHAQSANGPVTITVISVEGDKIKVDGNHPLAGVFLNFEVAVRDVREATPEEINHGHIHREGGCCGGHNHCGDDEDSCCGEDEGSCCGDREHHHGHGGCGCGGH